MSHRQRSLAGYSPYGVEELDLTEHACGGREGSDLESGTFKELKLRKPPSELKLRFPKLTTRNLLFLSQATWTPISTSLTRLISLFFFSGQSSQFNSSQINQLLRVLILNFWESDSYWLGALDACYKQSAEDLSGQSRSHWPRMEGMCWADTSKCL